MNDDSNSLRLSRRRMLGGLGVVGLASAGAGLGTTAYFNDVEAFVGNNLTAGSLDLFVHVDYEEDQGSYAQYDIETVLNGNTVGEAIEGDPLRIEVDDAKPGDSGEGELCFSVVDNPAYLWVCGALTANDQNGVTEPEGDALEEMFETPPGEGQLADAMVVTLSYCTEGEEGETVMGDEIVSGSLREVLLALRNGVPLDGEGDGAAPLDGRAPFEGVATVEETAETCVCLTWEIPTSVGNEIQTDSVMFDIDFYAEQSRHNDGTHNPCVTSREGGSFADTQEELEDRVWHARGIYGDGGGAANRELDIRLPNDTPVHSGDENYAWPNGQAVPFDLTISGGDAVWTIDDSTVTVSPAPVPVADGIGVTAKASTADASIDVENIRLNGSAPAGPDSLSVSSGASHLIFEGATLQEGDVISGDVTLTWTSTPSREGLGFRIDV
jgi:predicted ribosomally synthesized peptide with SipW-like signal peptide